MKPIKYLFGATLLCSVGAIHAQTVDIESVIATPLGADSNSLVELHVFGEKGDGCHRIIDQDLHFDAQTITLHLAVRELPASLCPADVEPGVVAPFLAYAPVGRLTEGDYTVRVMVNSQEALQVPLPIHEARPSLKISPPTGHYTTTQEFDMVIMLSSSAAEIESGSVLIGEIGRPVSSWDDVTQDVAQCLVAGNFPGGGEAFVCPNISGAILGEGQYGILATVTLDDGTQISDILVWDILEAQ